MRKRNEMKFPVMSLSNVSKTFQVKQGLFGEILPLHAISDISIELHEGEVVGLVGESGCGKSTLAKILLGLMTPTTGNVRIGEVELTSVSAVDRAKLVQPIFQDPYSSLNPRMTVSRIVGLPLDLTGQGDKASRARKVADMLDMVGLPQRAMHLYPSQMSGGQRQRVAIARALVANPRVLVCDEPTSALDVSVQSQILNLLQDLRTELKLTYLLISHNLSIVRYMADRLVVMYLGRIVEEAETERVFDHPAHPYSEALLKAVPTMTPGQGIADIPVQSEFPNPIHPPSGCTFHTRCPYILDQCRSERPLLDTSKNGGRVACHLENI